MIGRFRRLCLSFDEGVRGVKLAFAIEEVEYGKNFLQYQYWFVPIMLRPLEGHRLYARSRETKKAP